MPCLDVCLPHTDRPIKVKLISRLTEIGRDVAGFDPQIFRVRFIEYGPYEAGVGGKLWDGENHPYLHFLLYCPRLRKSAKRTLMEQWSRAFVELMGRPDWFPVIHICEHPYDNIAASGKPLTEKYPELAERRFYYELPAD